MNDVWCWNFPAYKDIPSTKTKEISQLNHIATEIIEAISAWSKWSRVEDQLMKNELRLECIVEVMDVIHSCETFLRAVDPETLALCQQLVVQKNTEREYYEE